MAEFKGFDGFAFGNVWARRSLSSRLELFLGVRGSLSVVGNLTAEAASNFQKAYRKFLRKGGEAGGRGRRRLEAVMSESDNANAAANERLFWNFFDKQYHPTISTTDFGKERRARFDYVREQLELNAVRRGENRVDGERTRHILFGEPITQTVRTSETETGKTASVRGWSGGHANPEAAKFGKTQIPDFWTGERFMYEVSDILADSNSRWFLQDADETSERTPRYVCVEERFGVPIRVVAERVDDEMKCVTAFPDYGRFPLEERRGILVAVEDKTVKNQNELKNRIRR